jgi:streptogramin lyase
MASPAATKTSSAFTKVALPNANALYAWTTGSDGSFWYANSSHSAEIGHVAPDGTIATFPIPTDYAVKQVWINGMAVGSDGNIWFSGSEDRGTTFPTFVRRMTPAGAFTTTSTPTGLSVSKMIAGPDGAVWFTAVRDSDPETHINLVGRITTDGQITTFPTISQNNGGGPLDICVGPDNAIWYTWTSSFRDLTTLTGRIGRVTLSGQVQEFAVPYAPRSIVSGLDGALWYGEIVLNTGGDSPGTPAIRTGYIGRITTAGVASELPISPDTRIGGLALARMARSGIPWMET